MTPAEANRVIVSCWLLEAGFSLTIAKQQAWDDQRLVRAQIALGGLAFGLSFIAVFAPQVAGPFALLVLVAMAARSRGQLGQVLGVAVPSTAASPRAGRSEPAGTPSPPRRGGR